MPPAGRNDRMSRSSPPWGPAAPAGQDQDQGGPRAAAGATGVQRPAPRPLPLDLATAGRRAGRPRLGRLDQHRDGAPGPEKNDIRPWIVATWCVPPDADAE